VARTIPHHGGKQPARDVGERGGLRRGFRILGVQQYSACDDVAYEDAVKLGRWLKIGASTLKISDFLK
jgi:hypothetical protein